MGSNPTPSVAAQELRRKRKGPRLRPFFVSDQFLINSPALTPISLSYLMRQFVHVLFGALGAAAVLGYLLFGGAAYQMLDPDGDFGRPLVAGLFGRTAKRHDYVGRGWLYRRLQLLCVVVGLVFWILFGLTS